MKLFLCNFFCQNRYYYLKRIDCIRKNIVAFRLLTYPPNEQIEILQKKKNKRSQALPQPLFFFICLFHYRKLVKRVPNIIIFLFVHIFFQCSFNYILIRLYHLAYYLRNTLSRFFDSCKILRIIIARIQVVTFREIFATCIIRGIYTTSRFFLLKIYFNGWEFFFDLNSATLL